MTEYTALLQAALKVAKESAPMEQCPEAAKEWRDLILVCRKELAAVKKDLTGITDISTMEARQSSLPNNNVLVQFKDKSVRAGGNNDNNS